MIVVMKPSELNLLNNYSLLSYYLQKPSYLHPKASNGHSKALYAHPKALYKQKMGLHSSQVQPLNFTMKNYVNPVGLEEEIAVVNYLGLHVELTHEHGG